MMTLSLKRLFTYVLALHLLVCLFATVRGVRPAFQGTPPIVVHTYQLAPPPPPPKAAKVIAKKATPAKPQTKPAPKPAPVVASTRPKRQALQQLKKALSSLSSTQSEEVAVKPISAPTPPTPVSYAQEVICYLQQVLVLPEFGEVHLRLHLKADGSVHQMEVLSASSALNRSYIAQHLPRLRFPAPEEDPCPPMELVLHHRL